MTINKKSKLENCRWCDTNTYAYINAEQMELSYKYHHFVECEACCGRGPNCENESEAIEKWNEVMGNKRRKGTRVSIYTGEIIGDD